MLIENVKHQNYFLSFFYVIVYIFVVLSTIDKLTYKLIGLQLINSQKFYFFTATIQIFYQLSGPFLRKVPVPETFFANSRENGKKYYKK